MGLRLAARSNGVAALHGATSRKMFNELWPDLTVAEVPIGSITNGVHGRSWTSTRVDKMLSRALGDDWVTAPTDRWSAVRRPRPGRCVGHPGGRAARAGAVRAQPLGGGVLDPDTLTIGFARRFATYKRATLLLSQPERLIALLTDADRPVQFVFAGKAHPADTPGKELIQQIEQFARKANVRPPVRVHAGLRHGDRPRAVPRRRRVAEHAAPSAGGVRHERDEGRAQRCAQLLDPRRLVGRVAPSRATDGRSSRRRTTTTSSDAISASAPACSRCSRSGWCRCSTNAPPPACRAGGWRWCSSRGRRSGPR